MPVNNMRPTRGKTAVVGRSETGLFAVGPVFNEDTILELKQRIGRLGYPVVGTVPLYAKHEFDNNAGPAKVKHCHHASVGVIVFRWNKHRLEYLLLERVKYPYGLAPVAGHLDGDLPTAAAVKELKEEIGLDITTEDVGEMEDRLTTWLPDHCHRTPTNGLTGHAWEIYAIQVPDSFEPKLGEDEATAARWVKAEDITLLADRTVVYAMGGMSREEFLADVGLEPAWVLLGVQLEWFRLSPQGVTAVARLAAQPAPMEA